MKTEKESPTSRQPSGAFKQKFPAPIPRYVADELISVLAPCCAPGRCMVAGSLRRGKPLVGDIEILFVPRIENSEQPGELFFRPQDQAAKMIEDLCAIKVIEPRQNTLGRITWGDLIKLTRHLASGIPVDFFAATEANWWNYLVCRTGPAESNLSIAKAAQAMGLKWKPYSPGFCRADDPAEENIAVMHSEADVFDYVGMTYHEPKDR